MERCSARGWSLRIRTKVRLGVLGFGALLYEDSSLRQLCPIKFVSAAAFFLTQDATIH
jgi:hypothetical protein